MINLEDYHQDLLQSVLSDSESRGLMRPQAFFEHVCEELITAGDLTKNYTVAEYTKKGMEVYGYDYDEERKILSILAQKYYAEDSIHTLNRNDIDTKFKRLENFYIQCGKGLYKDMEETSEAYSMAYNVFDYKQRNLIEKVRLVVLTDGKATRNLIELPSKKSGNVSVEFRVIDIDYLYKIYLSENSSSEFEVNVNLPFLEITSKSDEYQSYLTVMSGDVLVDIYENFGQKLFEQNVRTFLQFRGNVNKGLKNTLEYKPEMFFAYNNGITATGSEIEFDKSRNKIVNIKNFQIVNGGQTTSAIYAAKKNSKLDVSNVSVQVKLSVVNNKDNQNDFVSKVSEYANTQNKINKSDFFSNSPFHKEFKNYSKRIWVATTGGSQRRTHWFYERVRGEYLNEQAYLSMSAKKQFQLENPKHQVLDKTFLSKSEMSWRQKPHIVSKGAQYSFAAFAETITDILEKDNLAITERFFKDALARAILFRTTEKLSSKAEWYDGGFRAQTVAYTIAYLSNSILKRGKFLNFNLIWEEQNLPDNLLKALEVISETIYFAITHPPEGSANVAQWCKKEACWQNIKDLDIDFDIDPKLFLNKEEQQYEKREDKKEKKLDTSIDIETFIVNKPLEHWGTLLGYFNKDKAAANLSPMQWDILKKMYKGSLMPPSPKQANILYQLYEKAKSEGYEI